jgi:hypothetical protein
MIQFLAILVFPLKVALWLLVSACLAVLPSIAGLLFVYFLAIAVLTVISVFYLWFALPCLVPVLLPPFALYLLFRPRSPGAA